MNYIGSKNKLFSFISKTILEVVGDILSQKTFCDFFVGTGIVGRNFKTQEKQVVTNDVEYYSYVLNRNYQTYSSEKLIEQLNLLKGIKGFVYQEYSNGREAVRNYFTSEKGELINAARLQIRKWKEDLEINENQYYFLLASLLESADKIANTASIYGAYLKKIKSSAAKKLAIRPATFLETKNSHLIFQKDGNELIKNIKGHILYLDPPYNTRQNGANYHLQILLQNMIPLYPKE